MSVLAKDIRVLLGRGVMPYPDTPAGKAVLAIQLIVSYVAGIILGNVISNIAMGSEIIFFVMASMMVSLPLFALLFVIYLVFEKFIDQHLLSFSLLATAICGAFANFFKMVGLAILVTIFACLVFALVRFGGIGRFKLFRSGFGES